MFSLEHVRNKDQCLCFSLSTKVLLINVSTMFCLLCALSQNSSLRDAKPAGHLFVWFSKHCLAKDFLSFRGDADECEKQFHFVFCICLAFFDVRLRWVLDRNTGLGYNTLLLWLAPRDLFSAVPIDSSIHHQAIYTVGLHCQTPTPIPGCQAGRQFVPILWRSFVLPSRCVNPQPTALEADKLTTKPSQRIQVATGSRHHKMILYWGTKVWNIDINFVFFKNKIKD